MVEEKHPGPVLDVFKVLKVPAHRPVPLSEPEPESWSEVLKRLNKLLMRLTLGIPRLGTDILEAASSCLRGLVPDQTAQKIEKAHQKADYQESNAQELELHVDPDEAITRLENIITQCRVRGLAVRWHRLGDGRFILAIIRPELEEAAAELAQDAFEGLEQSLQEDR